MTPTKEQFTPCSACHGQGSHFHQTGPSKGVRIPGKWIDCKACNGTGGDREEVELTVEERLERIEAFLVLD